MQQFVRYAIYYAPREGAFSRRAAEWLGGDPVNGTHLPQPVLAGIGDPHGITAEPRRYGFHGTLRAPFRPAPDADEQAIRNRVADLAGRLAPVNCQGLRLENLHGFIALTPVGCEAALLAIAAAVVEGTNDLRAPLTDADIARRRPERLTPRQKALLAQWGYPFVMEEFRFHLTLTGQLADPGAVMPALQAYFEPVLPRPFILEDLCLFGEDRAGGFHLLHRYALSG